jgi:50S ribosomal protein L16 3-hydroxylase
MTAAPLRRLGALDVRRFLAHYWQRRAVCIRQAFPGMTAPLTPAQLFALAARDEVESRLVTAYSGRWRLAHGPFGIAELPGPRRAHWTLLVQGVDLHEPRVAALAAAFRFLPMARFDDVMISYAGPGGGVGPHVDQYDVFLLQAQGRRRWRIATAFDPRLVEGLPLRVLAHFRAEQEWVLEPGDMLYLPPGVAHEGVAVDACMTVSIGFRLPEWQQAREAWYERQGRVAPAQGRIPDATRHPTRTPARLPAAMVDAFARELRRAAPSRAEARRTLLEHLSEPKPSIVFEAPRRALAAARFVAAARRRGLRLDARTRMLYEQGDIGINGDCQCLNGAEARLARTLANTGTLAPSALCLYDPLDLPGLWPLMHAWYRSGWLHLAV